MTTLPSRAFDQDPQRAMKMAGWSPVFIVDRGRPTHVLLSIEAYRQLVGGGDDPIGRLGMPAGIEDVKVEFPRSSEPAQPADFS